MIYTIEIRRAQRLVCSISDRFTDDAAAIADAKTELEKAAAEEARVYKFGLSSRDRIAILKPL
jgi:hypothetical protein